jgi:fatty-acyl-CoA synthase
MVRIYTPDPVPAWPAGVPTEIDLPERSIAENLMATAARVPDKVATIYYGAEKTYGALAEEVEALAGWLQARARVARGDRVLLYMQNSPQYVAAYYAILRADAVVVPVNPMNRQAELAHLVKDTGAHVAILGQELLDFALPSLGDPGLQTIVVAAYAEAADPSFEFPLPAPLDQRAPQDYGVDGVVRWADALAANCEPRPLVTGPEDLAVIPYSSGTTGRPKGCMHSHQTVMATLVGGLTWNPIRTGAPSLVSLPLFHVTGMQNSMNGPVYAGETMVIMTRWDRKLACDLIKRYQVARWRNITTMAIDLINDPELDPADLASLQMIGGGGATMPASVAQKLKDITGLDYIEGYGMSETIAATHINPVDKPHLQCLGVPVFGVDSRVLDPETLEELPHGEAGEIVIHGPQVFLGYWNNAAATEAAFIDIEGKQFLRTGDIGRRDEDGYFYMTDRLKRMINVSGFKVWPSEIEAMMHEHPDLAEVCVVSRPHPRKGEIVVAHAVARRPVTEDAVLTWCRDRMAAYKCPAAVTFRDALPRSTTGKVLWREVQEAEA